MNTGQNNGQSSAQTDEFMDYASKTLGGQTAAAAADSSSENGSAPAAGNPGIGNPAAAAAGSEAGSSDTNKSAEAPAAGAEAQSATAGNETVDRDAIISEMTNGIFKTAAEFQAAIPKITEYDNVNARKLELEAEIAKDPFASPYVKTLNKLVADGATKDQIKAYMAVNEVGELSDLSQKETKIMKMVLVDGMKESVARRKVEAQYNIDNPALSDDEKEDLEEELRISHKSDLQALTSYKADLTIANPNYGENGLQSEVQKQAHQTQVQSLVPKISSEIVGLGNIKLPAENGLPEVAMDFNYPDTFRADIPKQLEAYFMDGMTPVTPETVREATLAIHAGYLVNNYQQLLQDFGKQVRTETEEAVRARYENRSGLHSDDSNANNPVTADQQFKSFQERVAGVGSPY